MKRIHLHLAAMLLLAMITSCVKDWNDTTSGDKQEGSSEIVLRIKTPSGFSSGAAARSLTVEDEHKIENIWVLAFNAQGELTEVREGENLQTVDATTRSFTTTLQRSKDAKDTYNLMVLANAEGIITSRIGTDLDKVSDKSYAAITALLNATISGKMYASGGTIPMWGESGAKEIKPGVNNNLSLSLLRSVARIDIGVGLPQQEIDGTYKWTGKDNQDHKIPFELKEVYVVKANNCYTVAPDVANVTNGKATAPTVPASTTPFTIEQSVANFKYADTEITASTVDLGSYTTQSIYIPEANVKVKDGAKSGDENHENRMAIVVGGDYNNSGRTTYYRLDLAKNGEILNALRNHLYQFNISKVSGFGYTDVETAYKSLSMNMQVDILDWNESEMGDVVFDGQNYFSISKSKVEFSPMGNESETVTIKTNVKTLELWEERDGGEHLEMKLGGTTEYINDDMGYKYTLNTMTAGSVYTLKIEATKHNVSNTIPDRLDKWRIKADRLNAKFEVDQQYTVLYVSYVNGQSQNLYPEGTLGNTIPIDIMALKPVDIKAEEGGQTATWIHLGNIDGLTTGNGGLYQARLEVEVDPFVYQAGVSALRTGTITVTPQGENPRVFTINQESPVFKFAKTTEIVTRKSGTTVHTYVDIITNLPETDFKITEKGSVGTEASRITHKDVFYNVDKANPRSRRFDVDVDMETQLPMVNNDPFEKTFTAEIHQKYGTLTLPEIKFEVLAGDNHFDWFWKNAIIPPLTDPYKFPTEDDNSPQYIFPWQTESVTIHFNSNNGVEYNSSHTSNKLEKGALVKGAEIQGVDGEYIITPYTFTFNKANYNTTDTYDLYFKSTTSSTLLEKNWKMGLGVQIWKRTAASSYTYDYKGLAQATPLLVNVTSNVKWEAAAGSNTGSYFLKMRPNATATNWTAAFIRDDQIQAPQAVTTAYDPNAHLVKSEPMEIAVEPYKTLNATTSPRTNTVIFKNRSVDAKKGGASIASPNLPINQHAPILKYGSHTPVGEIPSSGVSCTFTATTNIQSWGVRVYAGDDNTGTKLAEKAYGTSGISNPAPANHKVSITIPSYISNTDRKLSFYLYHTDANVTTKEVKIETITQSWEDFVIIDGVRWAKGNLIAKGNNDCIIGSPSDAGVYFQFGSLIGWTGGTNGDGKGTSTTIALDKRVWPAVMGSKPSFNLPNTTGANINSLSHYFFNYSMSPWAANNENSHIGTFNVPMSGDTGTGTLASGRYARLGVGDPCTYYLGEQWHLPTATELYKLGRGTRSNWTTLNGANGRWFGPNPGNPISSIFLSAAGSRYPGSGNLWFIGSEARYGSASVSADATKYHYTYINNSDVIIPDGAIRSSGMPIRCVRTNK